MRWWHFFVAFLLSAALVAGGVTVAAHRLQELRGERVELRLLPEPLLGLVDRAPEAMKGEAAFFLSKRIAGVFKRAPRGIGRLVSARRASRSMLFRRFWNELRNTFTKRH